MAYKHSPKEPIAIVGTGCRFPGDSTSSSKLWELLVAPRDLTKAIPAERSFNAEGYYHSNGERHGASNVTKSYFLEDDPRLFDSGFFSIAPREAEAIDTQQRLLLETVYEAMENAGFSIQAMKGSQTSVYCGAMSADYMDVQTRDLESTSQYMITGTSRALLANRLSYYFDWHGPSIAVDTACSSSLAAIHLGVQSLRNGEATTSCVAGSNLIMGPDAYLAATSLHLLSPSGRSRMWDDGADGYARGEGICAFLMKTLSQALKDGDRIDGLIRETCVNSDGRTKGIALPSAEAQAALISTAYKNAGLDILRAEDRPQYIEAHGTGTKAGDPLEARALSETFFPPGLDHDKRPIMLVGSIKTVIGHTEGTAGIAGVLKAILAMRHQVIPPNQHLINLNPDVAPYYKKLRIPTSPEVWPSAPAGHPLRASVNGFGSGGTNCHAIVESYVPEIHDNGPWGRPQPSPPIPSASLKPIDFTPTPLVFSATSEPALMASLENYSSFLTNPDISIERVALTLNSHRSTFPVRTVIEGTSKEQILRSIDNKISKARSSPDSKIGLRATAIEFNEDRRPRILGVFTGQGAQWPGMAQTLIKKCQMFRETIEMMETALACLPDPPAWSLKEEIMKPPATSRMGDAELSLPICAAVQVGLVQLLSKAGISFHTVVGHSGGEIGAAYAVGTINAIDAVKIAYYRGIVCKLAVGADGQRGSMIAVGFGYQDGLDFCASPQMEGRLTVAASNSPKSVTLAGDKDAVMEAKQILDEQGMFNRVLQVDTGYHSHHMLPCAEPYTKQLERCNIEVGKGNGFTAWVSSVYTDNRTIGIAENADMLGQYWTDNLIGRVLFSQALERALEDERGPPDMIIEVGPHPALRGPSLETVRTKLGFEVPYSGVLDRKLDDVTALSNALGFIWTNLGSSVVDFHGYRSTFSDSVWTAPLPDLPTYPWDHKQILWRESRLNKQVRSRQDRPHELLGSRTPDDTEYEPRWRNFLKLDEMPWLKSHRIQNQIVVPAAAYCVMALEAAKVLGRGKDVESIELLDMTIIRPIILDEDSEGTETLLSLRSDLDSSKDEKDVIRATFSLSAGSMEIGHLKTAATGEIHIHLGIHGPESANTQPVQIKRKDAGLIPVNIDQFYGSLDKIGLNYSGPFRALSSIERRMNMACADVAVDEDVGTSIPVHPTWLDVCFQTFLAAFAAPRDGSLWTAFMPTSIGSIKFFPDPDITPANFAFVDTHISEFIPGHMTTLPTMTGDLDIYNSESGRLVVRVEDFTMSSFLPASEKDDKLLYLKTTWQQDILSGVPFRVHSKEHTDDAEIIGACESLVQHYLLSFDANATLESSLTSSSYLESLITKAKARQGCVLHDYEINSMLERYGDYVDVKLIRAIGQSFTKTCQKDAENVSSSAGAMGTLITEWHNEGLGFAKLREHFVRAISQIAHKHERLRVLQTGPSSVGHVEAVCRELEHTLGSYTIVDDSPDMLEEMRSHLTHESRVNFHTFGIENDEIHSDEIIGAGLFDVIVVHKAFRNQAAALRKIRSLFRPGGFLIMMAATGQQLRFSFFLLASPPDEPLDQSMDAKTIGHVINNQLQDAGFSGVDSIGLDSSPEKHTFSVVVSQALDDRVRFLRTPSSVPPTFSTSGKIVILGGSSPRTKTLVEAVRKRLAQSWNGAIANVKSLTEITSTDLHDLEAVLSITELDQAILKTMNDAVFKSLQSLLLGSKTTLWITHGARSKDPYQSGTIGLFRTFQSENPQKNIQLLDLDNLEDQEGTISDTLLRLLAGIAFAHGDGESSPLWTLEEELVVEDGKLVIPRLFLDQKRNRRLNSLRRRLDYECSTRASKITLYRPGGGNDDICATGPISDHHAHLVDVDKLVTLEVLCSSIDPVIPNFDGAQLYCCLCMGKDGRPVIALSKSQSSLVTVPHGWVAPLPNVAPKHWNDIEILASIVSEIKTNTIVDSIPKGLSTLICNPDIHLIRTIGKRNDLSVTFVTSHESLQVGSTHQTCIRLGPQTATKSLKSQIPSKTMLVIDVGNKSDTQSLSTLRRALPANATIVEYCDLQSASSLSPSNLLTEALNSAMDADASSIVALDEASMVTVANLVRGGIKSSPHALFVDWTRAERIHLTSIPIETDGLFSRDKTYVLVGLTGQIGQSICRWMVDGGARHIVVTSRNPDKRAAWKDELTTRGANIVIEAADVTRIQDVIDLRKRILEYMPAIGGVANGAMVLGNRFFADMSFETFQMVLAPKVDGSINLDTVFSGDDLEFFLLFSSISAVTGQQGQANYAAANNFMVGLASQRRARSLPASVIDIGMVIGLGVIQRTDDGENMGSLESVLQKLDYMPVSERDLHQLLAEAILAGRSLESPEIVTGLHVYDTGHHPFWHKRALFSHLKSKADSQTGQSIEENVDKSLKERLHDAGGPEEALTIVEEMFLKYLASSLKLDIKAIYTDIPIIDLGIDSLVAVEIRNFVFTETAHDVPVLKILGGASIKQICTGIVSGFSMDRTDIVESPAVTAQVVKAPVAAPTNLAGSTSQARRPNGTSNGVPPALTTSLNELPKSPLVEPYTSNGNGNLKLPMAPSSILRKSPLSLGQSRLWFLSQYLIDDTVLNCTISYELSGKISVTRLEKSIEAVIKRHEALRTVFFTDHKDGLPMQGTLQQSPFKLRVFAGDCSPAQTQEEYDRTRQYHYNLKSGDTFVATLLSHGSESHTLIFGYHHIIMDGVSWQIFQQDLAHYYDNSMARMTVKPHPIQYIDFTRLQRQRASDGHYSESLQFFQEELKVPIEPLPLFPFAKVTTRKVLKQYRIQESVAHIDADLVKKMKQLAQTKKATSFHVFLSAFQVLLHRLLGVEQICIGVVDANRADQSFKDVVGFFLETIPVMFHVDSAIVFEDLLLATRNKVYASLARTGVPTEEILRACNISSSTTETPLFQVCFNYRMGAGRTTSMKEVGVKFRQYSDAQHPFDLVASVDELDDGTGMLNISLQDYLYDGKDAELVAKTYIHLLKKLSFDAAASVGRVPIFDDDQSRQSVALGTGRHLDIPFNDTLSKIVEAWSKEQPETLAVKDKHGFFLNYSQMIERASNISKCLRPSNESSGNPIAVLLDPCVDTVATILAIIRAGAAYVPLDVRSADATLEDIALESGSQILIYHGATSDRARMLAKAAGPRTLGRLINLDTDLPNDTGLKEDVSAPGEVAMILYTSGTTGKPKGIPMTNANLRATILGASKAASIGKETMLQQSGQGFDAAVYQIFTALANGGTLILGDNRDHPLETAALMIREEITCTTFIASEMQAMLKYALEDLRRCRSWRIAMVAGEPFTRLLADQFRSLGRPDLRIINAYGPTEASICTSLHEITPEELDMQGSFIPIGRAIPNHTIYIVDEDFRPVPVGWPGEIVAGGPGVTSGYLKLPNVTAEKFVQEHSSNGINKVFRTGDRGKMLPDGSIVMLGRSDGDDQVKIRGMRVNLRDISQAIVQESQGNVDEAAVVMRGTESSKQYLVAFAVMSLTSDITDANAYLRQLSLELPLPSYMRPVAIVSLDNLPLTSRGKLDLHKLTSMPLTGLDSEHVADEQLSNQEIFLRDIWRDVLGESSALTPLNRDSEFFAIGGNSLLLLSLKASIFRSSGLDISLPQLFQSSTLKLQAALLAGDLQAETIDWEKETMLEKGAFDISPFPNGHTSYSHKKDSISVLLTGATGFIGSAILHELVQDPHVANVHCVAIRNGENDKPRQLKVQHPKAIPYPGDLSLPNLGMSQATMNDLFEKVDVVIHNGAEVSHMKNYRSLKAANVFSTLEIARMTARKRIPFHFVSTGGVARLSGAPSQPEASLAGYRPTADGSDGYVASKWASEVILEKLNHLFQVPVWIHRPSSVTGDQVSKLDIIHSLLEYSRRMKAVPDLTGSTGALDFVHIDSVSVALARCAVSSALGLEGCQGGVVYIHHSGDEVVPFDHFKRHVEGPAPGSFDILAIQDWVSGALELGMDEIVGSLMLASKGVIRAPLLKGRG